MDMKLKLATGTLLLIISATAAANTTQKVESLLQQGEAEQALTILDRQLEQTPADANRLFLRARTLTALDKPAQAEQDYRHLIEQHPQMIEAYNNLAALLVQEGRLDDASQLLEQALAETDPAYATVYRNLQTVNVAIARHSYGKALRVDTPPQTVALTTMDLAIDDQRAALRTSEKPVEKAAEAAASSPAQMPVSPAISIEPDPAAIEQTVRHWAQAWAEQDVSAYLAFYASDFEPGDGLSRQAWQQQRRLRLSRPQWIRIELDKLTIAEQSSELAVVEFTQAYKSDSYADVTRKQLLLSRDTAGWRIVRENTL